MKLAELVAKIIADHLLSLADRLEKRIEERLDARIKAMSIPVYREVWDATATYAKGELVTQRGSIWSALQASQGVKPGTDEAAEYWRLAVKSGDRARPIKFALTDKGVLMLAQGDEPASPIGSIKPMLYDALMRAGILSADQVKALESEGT